MAAKTDGRRVKHVPLRTCISCKEEKPKRELLRIVRTPEGRIFIDITGKGKQSGRGAYLCARLSCWQRAMEKNLFEREFKIPLLEEDRAGLDAYMAKLPKEESVQLPTQPVKVARVRTQSATPEG